MRFGLIIWSLLIATTGYAVAQKPTSKPKSKFTVEDEIVWIRLGASSYMDVRSSAGGGFAPVPKGEVDLESSSAAILAYSTVAASDLPKLKHREKTVEFILKHYDPKTGAFAEIRSLPTVEMTAAGVIACAILGVPGEKYEKAFDYLSFKAKDAEEARLAAAALAAAQAVTSERAAPLLRLLPTANADGTYGKGDNIARETASVIATEVRLGRKIAYQDKVAKALKDAQREDGGWGQEGSKQSDLDTTNRVLRALAMLSDKPANIPAIRAFAVSCKETKGDGFGLKPGAQSSLNGMYHLGAVLYWCDEMAKTK